MDALTEQRIAGWILLVSGTALVLLGAWIARSGSTRWINGVDFSRIDPRDHPRAARIVGAAVGGIGLSEIVLAGWMLASMAAIGEDWRVLLAVLLPPLLILAAMFLRLQGLYRL